MPLAGYSSRNYEFENFFNAKSGGWSALCRRWRGLAAPPSPGELRESLHAESEQPEQDAQRQDKNDQPDQNCSKPFQGGYETLSSVPHYGKRTPAGFANRSGQLIGNKFHVDRRHRRHLLQVIHSALQSIDISSNLRHFFINFENLRGFLSPLSNRRQKLTKFSFRSTKIDELSAKIGVLLGDILPRDILIADANGILFDLLYRRSQLVGGNPEGCRSLKLIVHEPLSRIRDVTAFPLDQSNDTRKVFRCIIDNQAESRGSDNHPKGWRNRRSYSLFGGKLCRDFHRSVRSLRRLAAGRQQKQDEGSGASPYATVTNA